MAFSFTSQVKPGQRRAGEGQEQEGKAEGRSKGSKGGEEGRAGQGRATFDVARQGRAGAGAGFGRGVWGPAGVQQNHEFCPNAPLGLPWSPLSP